MKIKNYDTPTACKKNYYFSEKKKAIAFLLDCLNIRKLSQSKPQLSLHNHVVVRQLKKTFLAIGQLGIRLLEINCQLRN